MKAYIFLNGDFEKPEDWPAQPARGDLIVAADGGGRYPAALGWPLHCLVGDLDSLAPELARQLAAGGTEIERHPVAKDEIDFELALDLVRRRGFEHIEVLGALGGRWDMTLANILLPMALGRDSRFIRFRHGPWTVRMVTGPDRLALAGRPGDLLSLLPLGGEVRSVTLTGCLYPLGGEDLPAGLSRGLSNTLTAAGAELRLESGRLLVISRGGGNSG
ncbi:MAG: thiamine diphosphokinase [Candidatus Adiutrix sp.]|jgi:thiamine pyrophosphokinase|nr:thiamine diphosphokinase [Candidatus Adiutrix sp.]